MARKAGSGTTTKARRKPAKKKEKETLKDFDDTIQDVVDSGPADFGSKVFIHNAYARYILTPEGKGMSREQFNKKLIDAHKKGKIRLSRADLIGAMNPNDVRNSLIVDGNSTYNFIRRSN